MKVLHPDHLHNGVSGLAPCLYSDPCIKLKNDPPGASLAPVCQLNRFKLIVATLCK